MTHFADLTRQEASELAKDGNLYEIVETCKDEKSTWYAVGETKGLALEHYVRYMNTHNKKGFMVKISSITVARAKIDDLNSLMGIHIGAIADIDDDTVPVENPELQPVA